MFILLLPNELLFEICLYLDPFDSKNLSKTCRKFRLIYKDNVYWYLLCRRDHPQITKDALIRLTEANLEVRDWKSVYFLYDMGQLLSVDVYRNMVGSPLTKFWISGNETYKNFLKRLIALCPAYQPGNALLINLNIEYTKIKILLPVYKRYRYDTRMCDIVSLKSIRYIELIDDFDTVRSEMRMCIKCDSYTHVFESIIPNYRQLNIYCYCNKNPTILKFPVGP